MCHFLRVRHRVSISRAALKLKLKLTLALALALTLALALALALLQETNTVHSYYYGLNFDSVSNAFVTLLQLLIMNNWHVTHEACVKIVEDNAKLCSMPWEGQGGGWGLDSGGVAYNVCVQMHSKWAVSAYFMSLEFYVATILYVLRLMCCIRCGVRVLTLRGWLAGISV
eukprot:COSAG05_NODE_1639_length_4360_cov_2.033795_3_plen_170_part_00